MGGQWEWEWQDEAWTDGLGMSVAVKCGIWLKVCAWGVVAHPYTCGRGTREEIEIQEKLGGAQLVTMSSPEEAHNGDKTLLTESQCHV